MIPKKVYISVVVWDEGRKYDFLEVRERPYQTTDTQCHWCEYTDLSQVWHDASEKPRANEWLLIQFGEDDYDALSLNDLYIDMWCTWCNTYNVIRWAYISDLLPKGGEQ